MKKSKIIKNAGFLSLLLLTFLQTYSAEVLIEAENFSNKGGWVVDQQFMDQMGSPYLMAHGMGEPVENASTTINLPETGTYYVYVRTFNWTSPWYKGEGPGKFILRIGNKNLPEVLGNKGSEWFWQKAGKVKLKDRKSSDRKEIHLE